jgi:hypothetical protein
MRLKTQANKFNNYKLIQKSMSRNAGELLNMKSKELTAIQSARTTDKLHEVVNQILDAAGELEKSEGDESYFDTGDRLENKLPKIAKLMYAADLKWRKLSNSVSKVRVAVYLDKKNPDFGFLMEESNFKILPEYVAVKITEPNSLCSKKGVYQFPSELVENID